MIIILPSDLSLLHFLLAQRGVPLKSLLEADAAGPSELEKIIAANLDEPTAPKASAETAPAMPPTYPPLVNELSEFDYLGTRSLKGSFVRGELAVWMDGWRSGWKTSVAGYEAQRGIHKAIRRGTALHAANFAPPAVDPGGEIPPSPAEQSAQKTPDLAPLPKEIVERFILIERNAIYAEAVKLAQACIDRSILAKDDKERALVILSRQFYEHALASGQRAGVIVEAVHTITEAMRKKLAEYPMGFFMDYFALAFAMLVEIASGDRMRLRPIAAAPRSKSSAEVMQELRDQMDKNERVIIHEDHVVVDVEPDKTGGVWAVDLARIPTETSLLKYAVDLGSKTWADAHVVGSFILKVATHKGWNIFRESV